jgi:hypothetical protein
MGFFADLKTKREAKKAQRIYQLELAEWDRENKVLSEALEIFEGAAKGDEPDDTSLVQKKGELVLWVGNGNSGGPLVDNEGNVVGTNSFGQIDEQYNGAMSLNAMCVKIMECEGDVFWEREGSI